MPYDAVSIRPQMDVHKFYRIIPLIVELKLILCQNAFIYVVV